MSSLPVTEEPFRHAILEPRDLMMEADRNSPKNMADNDNAWLDRFKRERDVAVDSFDGRWRPTRYNASGRHHRWATTGHTVPSAEHSSGRSRGGRTA